MMSYAGIDLPILTPALAAWVEANIPPGMVAEVDTEHSRDALGCLPLPAPFDPPPIRPGTLYWPTGASRWATFHTVLTREQLDEVRLALIPDPSTDLGGYPTGDLVIDDDRGSVTVAMTMLPPRPLSGWSPEPTVFAADYVDPGTCAEQCAGDCVDPESTACLDCLDNCDEPTGNPAQDDEIFGETNDLYLVTLVDARYFWWAMPVSTSATTWETLFTDLLAAVGLVGTELDLMGVGYPPPGTRWQVKNQPPGLVMDAAAEAVGRRVIRRMDTGNVEFPAWHQARSQSQALYARQYTDEAGTAEGDLTTEDFARVAGGSMPANELRRNVPATVKVVEGDDGTTASFTATLASLDMEQYGFPSQEILGRSGETATIRLDDGITQDIADTAAADWYGWQLANVDLTLAGVAEWDACAWQDHVLWQHAGGRVITRVVRPPLSNGAAKGLCREGGTAGDTSILVLLTEVQWTGAFREYSAVEVEASGDITYAVKSGGQTFDKTSNPLYQERNDSYPVVGLDGSGNPRFVHHWSVVRARQNPNGFWYFGARPWKGIVRRTGSSDADGEQAYVRYNSASIGITWADGDETRLIEAE